MRRTSSRLALIAIADARLESLIHTAITQLGVDPVYVQNVREGCQWPPGHMPEIIIASQYLPDGDGMMIGQALRSRTARWLPVLICANNADDAQALWQQYADAGAARCGYDDVMVQAQSLHEVRARVEHLLQLNEVRGTNQRLGHTLIQRTMLEQQQTIQLEAVYAVGQAVSSLLDPQAVMNAALDTLVGVLPYESASIFRWDAALDVLTLAASRPSAEWGQTRFAREEGLVGWVFHHDTATLVNDTTADPRFQHVHGHDVERRRSLLVVPLRARGVPIGALNVSRHRPNAFGPNDLLLTESIAGLVASALNNADLYQQSRVLAEQYRALLAEANDAIFIADAHEVIVEANSRACEMLQRSAEDLIGQSFASLLRFDQPPGEHESLLQQLVDGGGGSYFGEFDLQRHDGTVAPVELSLSRVNRPGAPLYQGIARDLTERRRLEQQMVQSEKLRALGQMAAGVAHDFNNVLTNILGHIDLLKAEGLMPEHRATVDVIEQAALDGAQTVRRIQEFTRLRRHSELVKVDVDLLLRDALAVTRPRWSTRLPDFDGSGRITPHLVCPSDLTVAANAADLREVLVNLIFNAVDAMPQGGRLTLAALHQPAHARAIISVTDTGVGMADDVRQRIFDPFFTTKGPAGNGLGLSVAYGIVHSLGGFIEVESSEGQGSTFAIHVPDASVLTPALPAPTSSAPTRFAHILAVEDDPQLSDILRRMLERVGHRVTVPQSGQDALQALATESFDLVCTDLGMPDVNGWDVARAAARRSPPIPVILITGWGEQIETSALGSLGVNAVLAKPYRAQALYDTIARILGEARPATQ